MGVNCIPPGTGKTMLAKRVPSILPLMSLEEALETTKIHSIAGALPPRQALVTRRPFRSPHHTVSDAGLLGGGSVVCAFINEQRLRNWMVVGGVCQKKAKNSVDLREGECMIQLIHAIAVKWVRNGVVIEKSGDGLR